MVKCILSVESPFKGHVINDIAIDKTNEPRRCRMMASCYGGMADDKTCHRGLTIDRSTCILTR
jgi:hypothetical protein